MQPYFDLPAVQNPPHAVLVIVHGMAEHRGRYESVIPFFTDRGYAVCSFDLRGHGKAVTTEADRGHVDRFADFVADASAAIEAARQRFPQLPLIVWGHSMGAVVTIHAAAKLTAEQRLKVRGVVTSGVPLAAFDSFPKYMLALLRMMSAIAPRTRRALPVNPARLSRDEEVGRRYVNDPLVPKSVSLRLLVELANASASALLVARKISLPWLAMHGSADYVAPAIGSQRLVDALGSQEKSIRLWNEARHEVHNEIEPTRTEFLTALIEWSEARLV